MEQNPPDQPRFSTSTTLIIIVAISVALRLVMVFYIGSQLGDLPGASDQISYHTLAQRLTRGHGFTFAEGWWPLTHPGEPTSHWSFLYTFYLAGVYGLAGVSPLAARLIQAVLVGVFQPMLAFWIGARLFGRLPGIIAAALTAVYVYFIFYAATLMTEPFYILAILASLLISLLLVQGLPLGEFSPRRDWWLAGLLGLSLGLAVLLRQLFLLFIPFLLLWTWWARRKTTRTSLVWPLFGSLGIVLLLVLPFTVFNYARFQRFVLLNTNAGFAFYFGNHPVYGTRFIPILENDSGGYAALIPRELYVLDEASLDQELLKRGLQFVVQDPVRYALLSLSRVPVYFQFWPAAESGLLSILARVFSFGLLWPFMLYGLVISLIKRPWSLPSFIASPSSLLLLFISLYTLIHLLTWALIRYRLPVDAVLVIYAGLGCFDLYTRLAAHLPRSNRQPAL